MSNRDALRKLSRKHPASPEIEKIVEELGKSSDIALAITGSSLLDGRLEQAIIEGLQDKGKNLISSIFTNAGPLSTFHSKILVAQAYGVISAPLAAELQSIKAIRNAFAHVKTPINFDNEAISHEIANMKFVTIIKDTGDEIKSPIPKLNNKDWFLLIIKLMLINFDQLIENQKKISTVVGILIKSTTMKNKINDTTAEN